MTNRPQHDPNNDYYSDIKGRLKACIQVADEIYQSEFGGNGHHSDTTTITNMAIAILHHTADIPVDTGRTDINPLCVHVVDTVYTSES